MVKGLGFFLYVQYRLVCRLVQVADEEGEVTADGIEITGLTHQDLASHLGTVREHLSRCLIRLQDARLIKLGARKSSCGTSNPSRTCPTTSG